jgi:L-asparaginase / beta-aspartyl-peptidase
VINSLARLLISILIPVFAMSAFAQQSAHRSRRPKPQPPKWAVVLHGGAGVIERSSMTLDAERQYREGLNQAITAAGAVLDKGGTALDAVQAAIELLEDNPLFNAGRGSVFAADGTNQMDAAIMDGATLKAGAVANVQHTRHPIDLARAVMDKSPNVMYIGPGADAFSVHVGLQQEPRSFFFTERRWQNLIDELRKENLPIPTRPPGVPPPYSGHAGFPAPGSDFFESPDVHKYGTVGVVALDEHGNIAAGTSTGGITAKRWDRVGDSPIIGAGTYASNQSCAVSATGTGEYFIRLTVARTVCALVQYKHLRLQAAVDNVITQVGDIHGDGGVIAITPDGQMAWAFNTPGMFRARLQQGGKPQTAIYKDEP